MSAADQGSQSLSVRIYTKPGCHLCVQLVEMIEALTQADSIAVEEVNIELDEALFQQYRYTIPVLELPDGSQLYPPHTEASVDIALQNAG